MSFKKWFLIFILILPASMLGDLFAAQEGFSIYLTADKNISFSKLSNSGMKSIQLQKKPIITMDDVLSYNAKTHVILLTAQTFKRFNRKLLWNAPFVVCIGNERVYSGIFISVICQSIFSGVVIEGWELASEPTKPETIEIQLGYPSEKFFKGKDPRSDPRIIKALEKAGKLINGTN
jgi:hypothetical protein